MAEGKKSFIMYADYIHTVKHLTDEQAGLLFKHLLSYVNDEEPKTDNPFVNIAFEPIKQSLKRDLKKFKERKEERSKSGRLGNLKRYHKDLFDKVSNDLMELERAEEIAKTRKESLSEKNVAKLAVSDSDSESVSDSVDTKVSIYSEKEFLIDWEKCRGHFLKKPTNITRLNAMESTLFNQAINRYSGEEIKDALKGLFKQLNINFSSMVTRPKHFLDKIDDYYQAELGKDYKLYGEKVTKKKVEL